MTYAMIEGDATMTDETPTLDSKQVRNLGAKDGDWVLFQRRVPDGDVRTFYLRLGADELGHGECSGSEQYVGALTLIRQDAKFRCDSGSVWLLTDGALVFIEVLVAESDLGADAIEHAGQFLGGAK